MKENPGFYRPIQYLGAKTRTLNVIASHCKRLYRNNTFVVDMFSGSSIVSQSLYYDDTDVIANDVMQFCSDISSCMLNVSKTSNSSKIATEGITVLKDFHLDHEYTDPFTAFIDEETSLLQSEDLFGLKDLYSALPQVGKESSKTKQIEFIRNHYGDNAIQNVPLIANYYAGTYFGIKQAIRLDRLRSFIEYYYRKKRDYWVYTAMLTALYNTLSTIVHSAGKHFAQPITVRNLDKKKITNHRLFENRNFDVDELFATYLTKIITHTEKGTIPSNCISSCLNVQTKTFQRLMSSQKISVIYADPPYTAQQYSRFYHVPEAIRTYCYPILQSYRGEITQGLYPDNKFKSDFCSKTKALKAFETIFKTARDTRASLVISYSESQKANTGNERMVSRPDILMLAKTFIPSYRTSQEEFLFDYRQLNSSNKIVENKDDKEFLIIFEKQ